MAYLITKGDGTVISVADGSYDNSTSLNLPGKDSYGFGLLQNTNFVRLLEHFNSATAPIHPSVGQIWFDSGNNALKFYNNNNTWITVPTVTNNSSNAVGFGSLYFNPTSNQLSVNNGSSLVLIGPEGVAGYGTTKFTSTIIQDTLGNNHPVIECSIDGEIIAIISSSSFTTAAVTGFTNISRGFNFKNASTTDVTLNGRASVSTNAYSLMNSEGTAFISAYTLPVSNTIVQRDNTGSISADSISTNNLVSAAGLISGPWSFDTAVTPNASGTLNLGSSLLKWNNIYSQNLYVANNAVSASVNFTSQLVDPYSTFISKFDTDGTFASNSDTNLPTQKAVKTFVTSTVRTAVSSLQISPTFITPITVASLGQNVGVTWNTFNAVGAGIPAGTKAVLVDWAGSSVGRGNVEGYILSRISTATGTGPSPHTNTYIIGYTYIGRDSNIDGNGAGGQAVIPLRTAAEGNIPAGTFDFYVTSNAWNASLLRIIGYYVG